MILICVNTFINLNPMMIKNYNGTIIITLLYPKCFYKTVLSDIKYEKLIPEDSEIIENI